MANQVDFKILPSDQFNVYSPQTRSDKIITYFTLLSKLRGDILAVGGEDDPNDIVSAFYTSVGGTQTLHLVKADGSEVTASVSEPTTGTVTSVDLTAGTGISVSGGPITTSGSITVTNTAPDQVVSLTGAGTTVITGTYPSFTITSNDEFDGTVTSVDLTAGTGISVSGGPITTSGSITVTNTAPDQVVALTGAGTTTITGTYPNFTISSDDQYDGTVTSVDLTAGTGISVSGGPITTSGSITVTNTAPDQVVSLTGAGTTTITGTYPTFTITSDDQYDGTVTSVDLTAGAGISVSGGPITSSGSITVTNTAPDQTVVLTAGTGISTSGTYPNFTITNSEPDQTVALTASTGISVTGTYPNFTIENTSPSSGGTVTSVDLTAGTGISVSGGPITTSGSITVTNTAPDQTVVLTAGTGISTSGTYPNFTITNSAPDQTVSLTAGTGITTSGTYPSFTITNSAPDQTVALTAGTGISVTGTYPNFTITNSSPSSGGTVTSISTTAPITGGPITNTGTISITQAGGSNDGYLSSADWTTFNGKASNSFTTIAVSGQSNIVADSATDTLTIVAGAGISLTTNDSTDTLTITNTAATNIACFAAYTTQNLSLTTTEVEYQIDFDVESITNASFFTHSTTVDPEEITVLVAGKYEISMGYVASNGNSTIATVQGYVGINGVGVPSYSFLQLNTSAVGQYVATGFNTYIYDLDANDIITAIFFPTYVAASTGTITINPSGYDGSTYITIKKIG
jgi:hypothetical protein